MFVLPTSGMECRLPTGESDFSGGVADLLKAPNAFGFALLCILATGERGNNVFISPLSVFLALGMAAKGATGGTLNEFLTTLHLNGMQALDNIATHIMESGKTGLLASSGTGFIVANSLWMRDSSLSEEYVGEVEKIYNATVGDLRAPGPINAWVAEKTQGKIKTIISEIKEEDVAILVNAVYFKGDWLRPFKESKTLVKPFYLAAGEPVDSDFMSQRGVFSYNKFEDFEMIQLPYRDLQFQASILLPSEGQEVDTLLQTLTAESMTDWQAQLTKQDGIIELPKFKLENSYSLVPNMQSLGLNKPFGRGAEFSRMSPRPLFISEIIHKVFVEVNEKGTEAAAATALAISLTSFQLEPGKPDFIMQCNRPFIFIITERATNLVFFAGVVRNPTSSTA